MIYLDHAATTPLAPEAWEAMREHLAPGANHANPASDHEAGARARGAVEDARAQVAALLNTEAREIVFTSGATEADNLALLGAHAFHGGGHFVSTRVEHKAVLDPLRHLQSLGTPLTLLAPGRDGTVTPQAVAEALRDDTLLVSVMWVNNETGAINPVEEIASLCAERGVLLHVDAAQAAGRIAIDLQRVPVSLLSLSAHKMYGPKGAGALFVRRRPRARVAPLIHGGGHEQGMRSGTLATHQLAGFGVAAELALARHPADAAHAATLARQLRSGLAGLPGVLWNSQEAACVPHIVNVAFDGIHGEALRAELHALAVSSGSACSAATAESSYVLRALGLSDAQAGAALRISTGRDTTAENIAVAVQAIREAVLRLRGLAAA